MPSVKSVLVAILLLVFAIPGEAWATVQSRESRLELAQRVEQRAAATSFPMKSRAGVWAVSGVKGQASRLGMPSWDRISC